MSILQIGTNFFFSEVTNLTEKLEEGVYTLKYDERKGEYYLQQANNFSLPSKIYGDHSIVDRWLKTWQNTSKNLGICLAGMKGSGKTITAQLFCIKTKAPIIIIDEEPVDPIAFKSLITSPHLDGGVIFLDEFEKVFKGSDAQNRFLNLMDGAYNTHLVFLLTVNEPSLSNYMSNRLGRIKYYKEYGNLDDLIIDEIIEDRLVYKEHKQSIYDFLEKVDIISMDILVNVINDVNLFNESALECAKHLNIQNEPQFYKVIEVFKDLEYLVGVQKISFDNFNRESILIRRYDYKAYEKFLNKCQEIENLSEKDKQFIKQELDDSYELIISSTKHKILSKNKSLVLIKTQDTDSHYIKLVAEDKKNLIF